MNNSVVNPTISACILARNEELRIEAAIQCLLDWTDQIILIDNESDDGTVEIARRYTDQILTAPRAANFDAARNLAIEHATGDWIFYLDADERVPPRLGQALRQLVEKRGAEFEALLIPFQHYFCGKWMEHSGWWPGYTRPQLLKKGCFRYNERPHSGVAVDGRTLAFPAADPELAIVHYSYDDLHHYLEKLNRYTDGEAESLLADGASHAWQAQLAHFVHDWQAYYEHGRADLDGMHGFVLAFMSAFYRFASRAKLWDLRRQQGALPASEPVPANLREMLEFMARVAQEDTVAEAHGQTEFRRMPTLQALYQQALVVPSDISEHLETLYRLAHECRHVTELGTRTGNSTRAFLYAQPEVLVCYDRERSPEIDALVAAAREAGRPRLVFHQADVLAVEIEETDLLFIDTFHVYEQLQQELARHAGKARQYLVFHDTTTYGDVGERPGTWGLWPAIEEFLRDHPYWRLTARFTHNNGLTILTRDPAPPVISDRAAPRMPDTAIVVPVHNALVHVQRCLRSLVATCPELPLIVVDDGSDAATHAWLRHFLFSECREPGKPHHTLLRNERQQLFTRTVNRGLRWARQMRHAANPVRIDFVAVVNSDCVLHDHWLQALRLGMEGPRVGLVGYCDRADGREPALREFREPDYIAGHCILLRMQMLAEIGVLCETDTDGRDSPELTRFLGQAHFGSDRALCWRANRAGWKTLDCYCRLCDHAGGGSSVDDPGWLSRFELQPLWSPCDQLDNPDWVEKAEECR